MLLFTEQQSLYLFQMQSYNVSKIACVWNRHRICGSSGEENLTLAVLINNEDVKSPRSAFALCLKSPFIHLN